MGSKLSIISILSYLTGGLFCARSEWQGAVKPWCFTASPLSVDKDCAPERPARKVTKSYRAESGGLQSDPSLTEAGVVNGLRH